VSCRPRPLCLLAAWLAAWLTWGAPAPARACDLCAVYNADNTRNQRDAGWVMSIAEYFVPYDTVLVNGHDVTSSGSDYRDNSITHLVPGYNFSGRFGVSLNVPIVYNNFQRTEVRYHPTTAPVSRVERGVETGLGDLSLIGRYTVFEQTKMKYSFAVNVLGGVKFPTGDTGRIADEVEQTRIFDGFLPPGTPHDPLGHSVSGVHQHDLSPGSGSFDGIFGVAVRSRWQRWFLNAQFQYYLRTEGESTFTYGDELSVTGGPGAYVLTKENYTLSLQANASFDTMARDELLGRVSDRTGYTAWYLGPQVAFTWSDRFSAVAGVDVPLHITNNGLQNVPDYRVHANLVWRF